ncbi:MAG: radical SAM protein, partial [Chloroflexota bacterium]
PRVKVHAAGLIDDLALFHGNLIIQTLFLRGTYNGKPVDNTTDDELNAWIGALKKIKPREVMIYTISRDTPEGAELEKVPLKELKLIASRVEALGIRTQVSG